MGSHTVYVKYLIRAPSCADAVALVTGLVKPGLRVTNDTQSIIGNVRIGEPTDAPDVLQHETRLDPLALRSEHQWPL